MMGRPDAGDDKLSGLSPDYSEKHNLALVTLSCKISLTVQVGGITY